MIMLYNMISFDMIDYFIIIFV